MKSYLVKAGVPAELHEQALAALTEAKKASKDLFWAKWKTRLFRAGKIADLIPWEGERLLDYCPNLAEWDIAPAINITANGDNAPWEMTPEGGRPVPGRWLNKDPQSDDYKQAVAANYWCKGEHPRSWKSRKAWYRRNAGEYIAWQRGKACNPKTGVQVWRSNGVEVFKCGDAWEVIATKHLLGNLAWVTRVGYEIDNIWVESSNEQAWYPIPSYELRAPLTWSSIPQMVER